MKKPKKQKYSVWKDYPLWYKLAFVVIIINVLHALFPKQLWVLGVVFILVCWWIFFIFIPGLRKK